MLRFTGQEHVGVLAQPRLRAELARQELYGAADGAERIADLVGQAHGHAARRGERLAPPHLSLELTDPRKVAQDSHRGLDCAVTTEQRRRDHAHRHPPAVDRVEQRLGFGPTLAGGDRLAEAADRTRQADDYERRFQESIDAAGGITP